MITAIFMGVAVKKRIKNIQIDSRRLHRGRVATITNTATTDRIANSTDRVFTAYRATPAGSIVRHS